ncbi:MAG: branched-chain amino acid aminotransferase, partial [Cytophagales bacterium]|nr:branched-chain amino acid aminotransferase [Cytophagales bacterium]
MYYYNENTVIYLDGEWVKAADLKINVYNQTLHYGYGVFEGLRSYQTPKGVRVFKAKEHFERLLQSAHRLHIQFDYSAKELTDVVYQLLSRNKLTDTYIRPLIYLDNNMSVYPSKEVHLMMMAWDWYYYQKMDLIDVTISSYERPSPKSGPIDGKVVGHLTNTMLATAEARSNGFDEAILLDNNGYVAQGAGANLFIEKGEKV